MKNLNEKFTYDHKRYKVINHTSCKDCAFFSDEFECVEMDANFFNCCSADREDGNEVMFIELKFLYGK